MRVRFQADADLDGRILRGLRRVAPEIDIRSADAAGFTGLPDPQVLQIAADAGRVLVSQDRRTMPGHFARFTAATQSPGVILLREATPIANAIDELMLSGVRAKPKNGQTGFCGFRCESPYCFRTWLKKSSARGSFDWPSQNIARLRTAGSGLFFATSISRGMP